MVKHTGLALAVVALVTLTVVTTLVMTSNRSGADPDDPAQVAEGHDLYQSACASCHGVALEGQPTWRTPLPDGGFPAPPHDESGHTWHHPDALLFRATKFGGQAIAPAEFKSHMPGFGDTLSDEQIWSVLAYIMSTWPNRVRAHQDEITARSTQ